jgi:hypothetical protein
MGNIFYNLNQSTTQIVKDDINFKNQKLKIYSRHYLGTYHKVIVNLETDDVYWEIYKQHCGYKLKKIFPVDIFTKVNDDYVSPLPTWKKI